MSNLMGLDGFRRHWTNLVFMPIRPIVLYIFSRVIGYRISLFIAYIPVYPYKAKSQKDRTIGRMPTSAGLSYVRPIRKQIGRMHEIGRNGWEKNCIMDQWHFVY